MSPKCSQWNPAVISPSHPKSLFLILHLLLPRQEEFYGPRDYHEERLLDPPPRQPFFPAKYVIGKNLVS